jgi:hypothetical protein
VGFERTFERHLIVQQRRAVLDALASKIDPDATVGEVLDAAESLGWSDHMGELSLSDLADALLSDGAADEEEMQTSDLEEDTDEPETQTDEDEDVEAPTRGKKAAKKTAKATGKKTSKKAAKAAGKKTPKKAAKTTGKKTSKKAAKTTGKKTSKKAAKTTGKKTSKKAAKAAGKKTSKKAGRGPSARLRALRQKLDADEPMSLDEAAEVFLPIVEQFENATMQDLEEATGVGRRKLRFHVGQLVRHDYLERHGMGRGTYYSIPD